MISLFLGWLAFMFWLFITVSLASWVIDKGVIMWMMVMVGWVSASIIIFIRITERF